MCTQKMVKPPRRSNAAIVVGGLLLLMFGASLEAGAQEPQTPAQEVQVRRKSELHSLGKGKVIAEGRNTNALERLPVNRYTVEELELDEPVEAELEGKKTEVYQAYRITVFGGPFDMRAMPIILTLDEKTTLTGLQGPKLDKVTFILYDRSLLREGGTLAVGYGAADIELTDKLRLSEKRQ